MPNEVLFVLFIPYVFNADTCPFCETLRDTVDRQRQPRNIRYLTWQAFLSRTTGQMILLRVMNSLFSLKISAEIYNESSRQCVQ